MRSADPATADLTQLDNRATRIDLGPVRLLLRRIVERYHPEEIWLFGSRARGEEHPGSDWDLMVLLPDDAVEADLDPLTAWRLQAGSGVRADVVPCRRSEFRESRDWPNTLSYIVAREGVRLNVC